MNEGSSDKTEIRPSEEWDHSQLLFTPSSKCPPAFIKERLEIVTDNNWAIKKMNLDYYNSKRRNSGNLNLEEHLHQSEEERKSNCDTPLDTVSLSTDLSQYMASCAETLASSSVRDSEDSCDSKLDDVTVISISSDDDDRMLIKNSEAVIQTVLKDSSNVLISDVDLPKQSLSRSKSFTLECPSPLLLDALKEKRIGLEPSPDSDKSEKDFTTNMRNPKTRVPVSKSLIFSLSEMKLVDDKVANHCLAHDEINHSTSRKIEELPMPVLSIRKQFSESDTFFKDLSATNASFFGSVGNENEEVKETLSLSGLSVTEQKLNIFSKDLNSPNSDSHKTNENNNGKSNNSSITSNIESDGTINEIPKNPTNLTIPIQTSEMDVNNLLLKREKFKNFLDNFKKANECVEMFEEVVEKEVDLNSENVGAVSVEAKTGKAMENEILNNSQNVIPYEIDSNYLRQIQISHQQDEINELRVAFEENKRQAEEIQAMKRKLMEQEHCIYLLTHQLEVQQKDYSEWMLRMFQLQSVELGKKIKYEVEKCMQKFEMEASRLLGSKRTYLINNEESEVNENIIDTLSKQEILEEKTHDFDITGSDSSSSSVKTVIQSLQNNSFPHRNLFSPAKNIPKEIIIPDKALDPEMKPKFDKVSAIAKGFLTRRLMNTHKVQSIIKTIQDTTSTALQIHADLDTHPPTSRVALSQDVEFSKRLLNQLNSACHEFSNIFFGCSIKEQMALIAQSREMRRNPKPKIEISKTGTKLSRTQSLTPSQVRGSTFSKIQKRKVESMCGRVKRTSTSASPKQLTRRICRSSLINSVSTQPSSKLSSSYQCFLKQTPPKEGKGVLYDNRSPSFF